MSNSIESYDRPHLVFLVSEDWYFVSHRLPLARAAIDAGFRVTLATKVSSYRQEIERAGINLIDLPFKRSGLNPLRELAFSIRVLNLYRRLRPDLVHHVAMKPVVIGSLAARLAGVPAIVNALGGLGYVFTSQTIKTRLLRPVVERLLRFALNGKRSALILQNRDDQELLVNAGVVRQSSIKIIRGVGVDPSTYSTQNRTQPQPCLVVLPARMLRDKGVHEFVQAASDLRNEGINARFALVGSPDPQNPNSIAEDQLHAWAADGTIEYWGWRSDIAEVFSQTHIVCLPSYREGLPKALLEAAASSRAIITTDTPGCRDVVQDGYNGLLVPVGDAKALAHAIRTLILDTEMRDRFGVNGRRRIEMEFTSTMSIDMTLSTYKELLQP
ncbi:glycosyltransferase family 4 protein [Chitinivorax sp. PXF-14]|uniref:glycosyltransferase family 4 protein n=1 Tax=Chitinivorax sp. PXF-14 TaxID=3230488 RepID=UPI003465C577